jgi:predicted metal-dependent hydrolase
MRISVGVDGQVVVTTPRLVSEGVVENFIAKRTEWIERHVARTRLRTIMRIPRKDVSLLKNKAHALTEILCEHFAKHYNLSYKNISIRAQKSRWGSCSAKGNLSFNYKIAVLPPHMAEYIVVHEICHLAHMNHSKIFWDMVKKTVPDYIEIRKQLRKIHVVIE